jgi:protein-S-isoprenylcysteine O-methyltransferase Ste14
LYFVVAGDYTNPVHVLFTVLYCGHYFNRSFIWPMRAQSSNKTMPLMVVFSAIGFNFVNFFFQGTWIFLLSDYGYGWIPTIPFAIGLGLFFIGFYINFRSDEIMINLRKEKGEGYFIPNGFLFNKISNPNYFGEFIEWLGWAIMTWSWAGLVFFLWTICNLFPRAISNHRWYQENFEDYPKDRKAVIPNII